VGILAIVHRILCFAIWSRPWFRGRIKLYCWVAVAVVAAGLMVLPDGLRACLAVVLFGSLVLAPGLTLTTFVHLSFLTRHRHKETAEPRWVFYTWIAGWLVAYSAAWTKSYFAAIEAYYQLPLTSPGCYIATAAAQGHRRIVRSWPAGDRRINGQLALLKAGERRLENRLPRVHRLMRRVYDGIGPGMARQMRHPWIADLAYLTLKPIEWLTTAVLARSSIRKPCHRAESPDL
jgi:hypothetical protein